MNLQKHKPTKTQKIKSCKIMSYKIIFYQIMSYKITFYKITSYEIVSYQIVKSYESTSFEIIENLGKPIRDPIRKFSLSNAFFEIIGLACGLRHADWFLPSEIMTFKPQANPLKSGLGNPQSAKC